MNSLILLAAARILVPLQLALSIVLLLRGHNEPGGGFIGGLVGASAVILYGFAKSMPEAKAALRVTPQFLIGAGLLVAAGSGIPALLEGTPFLTGLWTDIAIPTYVAGKIKIGTPLFFDIGVYLVVVGISTLMIFSFAEEDQ
jgi:multicomponent Na+:H+ antiporter subunit B